MEIELFCCEPEETLIPRIKENCANYPARIKQEDPHEGVAVIVGGAPSVREKIESIRARQEHGQKIFALNGVCAYLNTHGIVPDYQVFLDPNEFLTGYFAQARDYLIASQCHPAVLAACPKEPILWHIAMEGRDEITPHAEDGDCLVGGGYTVGLTTMCVAYAMGFRTLCIYGFDSSRTALGDHCYPCPQNAAQIFDKPPEVICTVAGQRFPTTFALAKQAQEFLKLSDQLIDAGCQIIVDCGGLLRALVDENNRQPQANARLTIYQPERKKDAVSLTNFKYRKFSSRIHCYFRGWSSWPRRHRKQPSDSSPTIKILQCDHHIQRFNRCSSAGLRGGRYYLNL